MLRGSVTTGVPTLSLDLYSRAALAKPVETYRRIREAGAAVWLPKNRLWVMGRYRDVRQALGDDQSYVSGNGVAANPLTNALTAGTTLASDGEAHAKRRQKLWQSLSSKALCAVGPLLQAEASALIDALCHRDEFDGVSEFAAHLPIRVVADLVGVDIDHNRMRKYGRAGFDVLGPANLRALTAMPAGLRFWYLRAVHPCRQRQARRVGGIAPHGGAGWRTEPSRSQGHGARLHRPEPGHHDPGLCAAALEPRCQPRRLGRTSQ
jgi:cytochrome P450